MLTQSPRHNDGFESTSRLSMGDGDSSPDTHEAEVGAPTSEHTAYVELDLQGLSNAVPASAIGELLDDDPASLKLALAAMKAEAKRLAHAEGELQRAVRLRDGWLNDAREDLKSAENDRRRLQAQLKEAQQHVKELQELVATLKIDLDALRAAEPPSGQYETPVEFDPEHPPRLEPVGHDGPPVALDRKVITVGRTNESDMCVGSSLVSRDHARILVSSNTVTIVDVGSVNGCFVNQRQVKKQVLREGDVLRFADRAYKLTLSAA